MGPWGYIAAAYGIAAVVLLGYHLVMSVRLRAFARRLSALRATAAWMRRAA
ncbi:MAG: hypothetical protein HYV08_08510 [Deltaproteobacteria bacterium]|nr:hypothetical protein [Deltaproteobacteria bacterium]